MSMMTAAQTTTFTYQGRLTDVNTPLGNGTYDFQFALFDASNNQIGATQTKSNVQVANGIFTIALDFGANPFVSGADRFLQIAVKRTIDANYTTLMPRQAMTSLPFAVQSLNSALFSGLSVDQFIQENDSRLSDERNPSAGSANYIQNGTTAQAGNFNVSGTGTIGGVLSANSVDTATNYKIGNIIVFSTPNQTSVVAGQSANHSIVSPNSAFFGYRAGFSSSGFSFSNTFIGSQAGQGLTNGWNNTFVGKDAGFFNTTGTGNSIFGASAGIGAANSNASSNSIFGFESGATINGNRNSFFGYQAGKQNQTAVDNAFFGYQAGAVATGSNNSFFGSGAGQANTNGNSNAFFGKNAGGANTTGNQNVFVGIDAGGANTSGSNNIYIGTRAGDGPQTGGNNTIIGTDAGGSIITLDANTSIGYQAGVSSNKTSNTSIGAFSNVLPNLSFSTAIGAGAVADQSHQIVLGTNQENVKIPGDLSVGTVGAGQLNGQGLFVNAVATLYGLKLTSNTGPGTGNDLCIDNLSKVVICSSSSLRYKNNISDYTGGLKVLGGLRPITFEWKSDGTPDVGFVAEEVERADPRLVFYKNGQVDGVKYNRISLVLVNSIKEQQAQIKRQQQQIEELKAIVCSIKPDISACVAK